MRKDLVDYKMDAREWEKAIDDFVKSMENHSGVDGDFTSHKSSAICWRYQKAKGITKKRAAPVKRCCPFLFFTYQKSKEKYL